MTPGSLRFADGSEVVVTAHVIKEGTLLEEDGGGSRQRLDLETEEVARAGEIVEVQSGLRLSVYGQQSKLEPGQEASPASGQLFHYGERLRFPAKLSPPRNFRNPGAFDYRAYLNENGIAALTSTKSASVEVLPGFSGNRLELWRSRIHRGALSKNRCLVAGTRSRVDGRHGDRRRRFHQPTNLYVDFQRSSILTTCWWSGDECEHLALVTFWFLRRVRVSDLVAGTISVAPMVAYAFLNYSGAPVWRATLMLALYLGARLLDRVSQTHAQRDWATTGLDGIVNPRVLFGASFQLTFLCVWLVAAVGVPIGAYDRTFCPGIAAHGFDLL